MRTVFAFSLGILFASLPAGAALGEGIDKWRTPEGSLYFGNHPPSGSTRLGTVEALPPIDPGSGEAVGAGEAEEARERVSREAEEIRRRRAEQREAERAREEMIADAIEMGPHVVTESTLGWVVVGTVRNTATEPVRDVRVGAGTVWAATDPGTIDPQSEASFRLEVPRYPRSDADVFPQVEVRWRGQRR